MKQESKQECWKFLPVGGKDIKQYVYKEKGTRARFTENPDDPIGEIARFVSSNPNFDIILLPPCSIECVNYVSEKYNEVVVVDYDENRLKAFDEEAKGSFKLLHIAMDTDFRDKLSSYITELSFGKVTSFIPSRYARLDHRLRCLLKEELLKIQQEYCSFAVNRSLKSWHRALNAIENIKNIDESIISLPYLSKQDVVIVGAGPSLDETVTKLEKYKNRYFIIATDGALKTLLKNKIVPDFIVSCEDTVMSWQFFVGYFELLHKTPLVAPYNANHYLLKNYPGPICLTRDKVNETWTDSIISKLPEVNTGRCVGHMAYNLAIALGAGRIIMTGFDLAFKGEVFHPKDMAVPYFHEMELPVPVTVTSIYGEEIKTDLSMKTYLKDFEYLIQNTGISIIDATEGGALIKGTELKSLDQIIYKDSKVPVEYKINKLDLYEAFKFCRKTNQGFFEQMALCFTSYLVQNSNHVLEVDKLADRSSAFELLECLLTEKQCREGLVEALLLPPEYSKTDSWFLWALENNIKMINSDSLCAILLQVKTAGIDHLYCIDGEIPPDVMALTDINCSDIKTDRNKKEYERSLWLKKYKVLTSSELCAYWESQIPDNLEVIVHESVKNIEKVANGN